MAKISDSEIVYALMTWLAAQGKNPSREQLMQTLFDLLAEAELQKEGTA